MCRGDLYDVCFRMCYVRFHTVLLIGHDKLSLSLPISKCHSKGACRPARRWQRCNAVGRIDAHAQPQRHPAHHSARGPQRPQRHQRAYNALTAPTATHPALVATHAHGAKRQFLSELVCFRTVCDVGAVCALSDCCHMGKGSYPHKHGTRGKRVGGGLWPVNPAQIGRRRALNTCLRMAMRRYDGGTFLLSGAFRNAKAAYPGKGRTTF